MLLAQARLADKDRASALISKEDTVMFKEGLGSSYKQVSRDVALAKMEHMQVGIDVDFDTDSGKYFISMPFLSDMRWGT